MLTKRLDCLIRRVNGIICTQIVQRAGLPTVVCGPGSIDQAHKPDEFIDISQIEACIGFMQRLADEMNQKV